MWLKVIFLHFSLLVIIEAGQPKDQAEQSQQFLQCIETESYKSLHSEHRKDVEKINSLTSELEMERKEKEHANKDMEMQIKMHRLEIFELKFKHNTEISELESNYDILYELKLNQSKEIENCQYKLRADQNDKESTNKIIDNILQNHKIEISELKSKCRKEISALETNNSKEISTLKSSNSKEVLELISNHNKEINKYEYKLRTAQNETESAYKTIDSLLKNHTIEISELNSNRNRDITELKTGLMKDISNITSTLNAERKMVESLKSELRNIQIQLKNYTEASLKINQCSLGNLKNDKSKELYEASMTGRIVEVEKLLIDCQNPNVIGDYWRNSPLLSAAGYGHWNVVPLLIQYGADVNHANLDNSTALIWSSYLGNKEIIQLLLQNGANIDHQNRDGGAAIWWAAHFMQVNAIKVLIEAKADVNIKTAKGNSPLMAAIYSLIEKPGRVEIVELLVKNGAKVNEQDNEGRTAIWYAARELHIDVMKILLKNKADPNIKDNVGKSPLEVVGTSKNANRSKIDEAIALLKSATKT